MKYHEELDTKINMLIDLMLTDGVSPSEFADNIFSEDYSEVTFCKNGKYIVGKLVFHEDQIFTEMRYTYIEDKRLIRVEEKVNDDFIILWDRETREIQMVNEILDDMRMLYKQDQILHFIETLPTNIQDLLLCEIDKSA